MTQQTISGGPPEASGSETPLPWAAPEIAAVAILIAFGLIVLGGLATGLDLASSNQQNFFSGSLAVTWDAMVSGASWAEPLLAIVLLGVTGLCWWQVDRWSDEGPASIDPEVAGGYIQRSKRFSSWARVALVVTAVGAMVGFIATVGFNVETHPGQVGWSRAFYTGAETLAVLVVALAGALVVRETERLALPPT